MSLPSWKGRPQKRGGAELYGESDLGFLGTNLNCPHTPWPEVRLGAAGIFCPPLC